MGLRTTEGVMGNAHAWHTYRHRPITDEQIRREMDRLRSPHQTAEGKTKWPGSSPKRAIWMDEVLRCIWCNQVIGTHEPMVLLYADGEARETSALREDENLAGDCYHRGCFREAYPMMEQD